MRLDRTVAARGLARSRSHAQELIAAGVIAVNGAVESKPSRDVSDADHVALVGDVDHYVSRAAHKLVGALSELSPLGLAVEGRRAYDAGASTGGFTQVLLEAGASHVTSVDVGHGQLAPMLADDPRVTAIEGFNVRDFTSESPGAGADIVVGDLSFISLTLVIEPLASAAAEGADLLLLIKPQFELSRSALDKHGVVTKASDRRRAIRAVCDKALEAGLEVVVLRTSVLPGPTGNVEFFMWARKPWQARGATAARALTPEQLRAAIDDVVEGRP